MAVRKTPEKSIAIITEISVEKLNSLMERYGIEAGDYFSLALRLAIEYVPGFPKFKLEHGTYGKVMRDKGGRKAWWTPEKRDELISDVDRVKKKYGFSTDNDAIKHLAKAGKWARQSSRDPDKRLKTLKNTLAEARTIRRRVDQLNAEADRLRAASGSNPEN